MAVVALVSAIGLLYGAKWAKVVAVILSFWASMGSFPVLIYRGVYMVGDRVKATQRRGRQRRGGWLIIR